MKETGFIERVHTLFHDLFCGKETRADRITLTLLEETPSGPYWDIRVEGTKNFSLFSDSLVLNLGPKRPAIMFTRGGMVPICSKCGGEIRYGIQGNVPTWWCDECGHHKIASV